MNLPQFQAKWRGATLKERSASQEHFLDLCRLFGQPTPAEADRAGVDYAFEKGAAKTAGGQGFADVWRRGYFAWEYKGPHADLGAAYRQLQLYLDDLENPPLLVVSDLDRFVVRTHFTGTPTKTWAFDLAGLSEPANLAILRAVFTDPNSLRPGIRTDEVTKEAAARFGALAAGLHGRGVDPHRAAHFLVQLLFCLFAEDVGLLPKGLFTDLVALAARRPELFPGQVTALLEAMRDGGVVGLREVDRFNGGLFAEIGVEPLTAGELASLRDAAALDWGAVEPAIFGTLFERSLDPAKRSQLGAHYTGKDDILRVVEPVLMAPLRRRWETVRADADRVKAAWDIATTPQTRRNRRDAFAAILNAFKEELAGVRVLDPACGSGNFLYVALAALLDLEKETIAYGAANGLPLGIPAVGPGQLAGLEVNAYARELAQVVVWIGYLQWMIGNGFPGRRDPILEPLETIRLQDALLDRGDPTNPKEAAWPESDFIIGNPPFVGNKKLRGELGGAYTDALWRVFRGRIPPGADLVTYFFEKARAEIEAGRTGRAGLLATQSIRVGENRNVLERIKRSGEIFMAWDDEPWILDGAAVRISIVGFDGGVEHERTLDGRLVESINADLTTSTDVTKSKPLSENQRIAFFGDCKGGPFDVSAQLALEWLHLPSNPNGRPNQDVVKRRINGQGVMRGNNETWIVDFGPNATEEEAALYEAPFEYIRTHVKPIRDVNRDAHLRRYWWLHQRPRPEMRAATAGLNRFLVTPTVAKHRVLAWVDRGVVPDHKLVVFARDDDYWFGVLHSRAHEVWSLRQASRHGVGNDPVYNIGSCFETFPLPWPPGAEPAGDARAAAVAAAAADLDRLRRAWLDPAEADAATLKTRTLTNLYNQRPTWLAHAHAALDRAVWAAYGWTDPDPAAVEEDAILGRLLALNLARADGRAVVVAPASP